VTGEKYSALSAVAALVQETTPAYGALLRSVDVSPEDLRDPAVLERIPVTSKERFVQMQREDPPYGGFRNSAAKAKRIYVSPGPLYNIDTNDGLRLAKTFRDYGVTDADVVLNAWTYHLHPAGTMVEDACLALGATVIPAGTGNSEIQAQAILDLGVTIVAASGDYFLVLLDRLKELGARLPADWQVTSALLLSAGTPDWLARRADIEKTLSISTFSTYGSVPVGLIGSECKEQFGYHIDDESIVQICDPVTGAVVEDGDHGEVVVTSLNTVLPVIRFGTGDTSSVIAGVCPCGDTRSRLSPIGRVGSAIKVREVFVYPHQIVEVGDRVADVTSIYASVVRRGQSDEIDVSAIVPDGSDTSRLKSRLADEFRAVTRLRVGEITFTTGAEAGDGVLTDKRGQAG
jgi:phenylacetate-CoA ligase